MNDRKDFIIGASIGLGAGILLGGIAALLFAPKSGHDLREDIKHKAESIAADIRAKTGHATLKDIKS